MTKSTDQMVDQPKQALPEYENPPIVEVACGVRFEPLSRMRIPHFGAFWGLVREEFPTVEHASPITSDSGEPVIDQLTGLPLPRVFFISKDETRLLQAQTNLFYFNWRRKDADSEYPRFPQILERFEANYAAFQRFLSVEEVGLPSLLNCELTYTNHIHLDSEDERSPIELGKLFRIVRWESESPARDGFLSTPTSSQWTFRFNLPESLGWLGVKIQTAKRKTDNRPLVLFELTARGIGKDKTTEGLHNWFEIAREWIVRGFADLTNESAQRDLWKRTNV